MFKSYFTLVILSLGILFLQAETSGIRFEPSEINLAEAYGGITYVNEVRLVNETDSVVEVKDIDADCGCSVAELTEKHIQPQSSIPVSVSYTLPAVFAGRDKKNMIAVETSARFAALKLQAKVLPKIGIDKQHLDFGKLKKLGTATQSVVLKSLTEEGFDDTLAIESPPEGLRSEIALSGKEATVNLKLSADAMAQGDWAEQKIHLKTNIKGYDNVSLYLNASLERFASIEPSKVNLGFIKRDEEASFLVKINSARMGESFRIEEVLDEKIKPYVNITHNRGSSQVGVNFPVNFFEFGELVNLKIALKTNDPQEPILYVPVIGAVLPEVKDNCCGK